MLATLGEQRVVPARLGDDRRRQRIGVVRADEPEASRSGEGEVEQRLVSLALDELLGRARREDRLADPAQPRPAIGVPVDELPPGGDDPRRIGADGRHVTERDRRRVRSQRLAERVELGRERDHERRLTRVQAGPDETGAGVDELIEADVEQRLVSEATRWMRLTIRRFGDGHSYSRRGPATPSTPPLSIFATIHAAPGCIVALRGCR